MRGARDIARGRDEVTIEFAGPEVRRTDRRRRTALVLSAFANGDSRPKWVALGSENSAGFLRDVLGTPEKSAQRHTLEHVELDRNLLARLRDQAPDEVYFVLGGHVNERLLTRIGPRLLMDGVALSLVLPGRGGPPVRARPGRFGRHSCVSLLAVGDDRGGSTLRRVLDVIGAILLALTLAPLLAGVAAAVWWQMGSPTIFTQQRVGQFGRRFRLYKFRSMVSDAEAILLANPNAYSRYVASNYKLPEHEDPRITALGRFLRRSSLDELPQLWNVLRGDMSLVGPRPVVPAEVSEYGEYARLLLRVKPGLTGSWQVSGRSTIPYPDRARMELDYVAMRTLARDIGILLRTLPAVIRRRGAL